MAAWKSSMSQTVSRIQGARRLRRTSWRDSPTVFLQLGVFSRVWLYKCRPTVAIAFRHALQVKTRSAVVSFSIAACAAIISPAVVAEPTRIAEMAMSVVMIIYASTLHWRMGEIVNTVISATAIVTVISKYSYLPGGLGKSTFLAVLVFFLVLDVKVEPTRALLCRFRNTRDH